MNHITSHTPFITDRSALCDGQKSQRKRNCENHAPAQNIRTHYGVDVDSSDSIGECGPKYDETEGEARG